MIKFVKYIEFGECCHVNFVLKRGIPLYNGDILLLGNCMKKFCLYGILIGTLLFVMGCSSENEIPYDVGDILLSDNSIVSVNNFYSVRDEKIKPVGIIVGFSEDGDKATIMGIKRSDTSLRWAPSDTTGYNTKFKDIEVARYGSVEAGYSFSGDYKGIDNWFCVCKVDSDGVLNSEKKYPAFNYANNYGSNANLEESRFEHGWYLPSILELYDVYKNKDVIKNSLDLVGGFDLDSNWYWSSSQAYSKNEGAYGILFPTGEVTNVYKYCPSGYVIAFCEIIINEYL